MSEDPAKGAEGTSAAASTESNFKAAATTEAKPSVVVTEATTAGAAEDGAAEKARAERRRKRKSRWGSKSEDSETKTSTASTALVAVGQDASATETNAQKRARKRRSRWGSDKEKVQLPPQLAAIAATQNLTAAQTKMMLLKLQLQQVSAKLLNPAQHMDKEKMSPSPEPIYDANGKRTNTRDIRFQQKTMAERQKILDEMVKIDPSMAALVPKSTEWIKLKIPIPVDKHPDYNFIGLIIGPRGNTQKRLQKETGAKIFVRGKEPNSRKMSRPHRPEDDEPLHVLITAREQSSVDKAEALIKKLLVPVADHENKHKAMQLRELAAMNGTALDVVTCRNCGEQGHRIFECPKRQGGSGWVPANIKCAICGSDNHPTIDCPNRGDAKNSAKLEKLNDEYSQFMAELGGAPPKPVASTSTPTPAGGAAPVQQQQPAMMQNAGGGGGGGGGGGSKSANDWVCTSCSNSNYSFRTRCNRCGADRKDVDPGWTPQAAAAASKGDNI
eukprot:jgi/Bigna1/69092/fgenesh1_pg.8_\